MGNAAKKCDKIILLEPGNVWMLANKTHMVRDEIENLFYEFRLRNPNGSLNKKQFIKLIAKLYKTRHEMVESAAEHMFATFDVNNSGEISFDEFLVKNFNFFD